MPFSTGAAVGAGALMGIFADLAYNAYGATNSSPQTTELFAEDRAGTLWKYVRFGHAQAFLFGTAGAILEQSWWPLAGSCAVIFIMHSMYAHALYSGQKSAGQQGGISRAQWGFQW